jgi:HD-like signal output (HDOD) protein
MLAIGRQPDRPKRQYGISPDAAYTYALFHDAGVPMMMRRFPELRRVA